jgi:polar amino acid transport system substrate-binding protein
MAEQLTITNSHWPPWRVLENDGSLNGIDIDILKGLSTRLDLQLITKGCGWKRCLKSMELGESDVMTGLFKTPEREKYMQFIEPPYRSVQNTCFYLTELHTV